jgi:hypothetical protein
MATKKADATRIKKKVAWDKDNDIALLRKVMGIASIDVNNITVKK